VTIAFVTVPSPAPCELSVVLPCFNERDNLQAVRDRLLAVLERAGLAGFEVLFVDDASTDGSDEIIRRFHAEDACIKLVRFSRNFGHQAALTAGLEAAAGRAVVLMDCDLQDPPETLPAFLDKWREGFQVVYGVRRARQESWLKRTAYAVFYRSLRAVAHIDVPLDAGDFCLLDRRVVDTLKRFGERHVFLRGLRAWVGFARAKVVYERPARFAGETKYGFRKLLRLALSGYVGFSSMPLRLAGLVGTVAALGGFGLALWAILTHLFGAETPWGWASTVSIILVLGGMQLLVLGIIGEYLARVYDEVRQRPRYIVEQAVGVEAPKG
jgi:dolichol-phosphate mannosyltransferase